METAGRRLLRRVLGVDLGLVGHDLTWYRWEAQVDRGHGRRRIATRPGRPQSGGLVLSPNRVYTTLVRHRLTTRATRLAVIAGYRTIRKECRRPALARSLQVRLSALRRDLAHHLHHYNLDREH